LGIIFDTDVVIHLRDGDEWTRVQARELEPPFYLSAISRVELENGIWRQPKLTAARQAAFDALLPQFEVLAFGAEEIAVYSALLAEVGYSRRKVADRMTAATALARELTLVTMNAQDFRDVPGLSLIEWVRPSRVDAVFPSPALKQP
jgi:predicted nucleic acid-binding protein